MQKSDMRWSTIPFLLMVTCATFAASVAGQQPFVTDDADVTEPGVVTVQIANEIDRLQPSAAPVNYQNGSRISFAFGVANGLEVSVGGQYLALISTVDPRYTYGFGDSSFAVKYNFLKESRRIPALTVSAYAELPTGSSSRGLGTGAFGFGINTIAQKTVGRRNTVRVNLGYLAAGSTLVGDLGIATVRGHIFTGGASVVRAFNDRWQLGAEVTTAVSDKFQLSRGQLQAQFGGNYQLTKRSTVDFGLIVGRYSASPRVGFLIGYSRDITFKRRK